MIFSTIKAIQGTGSWVSARGDTMYGQFIEFTDGTKGAANTKTEVAPYHVGDSVGYDITGKDKQGNAKLKIDRKAAQQAGITQTPAQAAQQAPTGAITGHSDANASIHPATAGCAFKSACEVLGKPTPLAIEDGSHAKAVWELASQFVRVLYKLEKAKLAPKVGEANALHAAQAMAAANGFTPAAKTAVDPEDVPF